MLNRFVGFSVGVTVLILAVLVVGPFTPTASHEEESISRVTRKTTTEIAPVLHYKLWIDVSFLHKKYYGSIVMHFGESRLLRGAVMKASSFYNVTQVQMNLYALRDPVNLGMVPKYEDANKLILLARTVHPERARERFDHTGRFNFTLYFESDLTDETNKKEGLYISKYKIENDEEDYYYAILACRNRTAYHAFPHYYSGMPTPMTFVPQEDAKYNVITSGGLLDGAKEDNEPPLPKVMPPYMLGLFISQFKFKENNEMLEKKISYGVYFTQDYKATAQFLALDQGGSIFNEAFIRLKRPYVVNEFRFIVLPHTEPNVLDSWGLIYYHGDLKVEGIRVNEFILLNYLEAATNIIPMSAANKMMLLVTEKNIHQCLGFESLFEDTDEYLPEKSIVDFMKHVILPGTIETYNTMEIMYLEYIQESLWQNHWNFSLSPPVLDTSTAATIKRVVKMFRVFYDFLLPKRASVEHPFIKILRTALSKYDTDQYIDQAAIFNDTIEFMKHAYREEANTTNFDTVWLNDFSYPIVEMRWYPEENKIVVTQRNVTNDQKSNWVIPIMFQTHCHDANKCTIRRILDSEEMTVTYETVTDTEWILLNPEIAVPYRVNYDPKIWDHWVERLFMDNYGGLTAIDRAKIVDDVMELAYLRYIYYSKAMIVIKYLHRERDMLPWYAARRHLRFIYTRLNASTEVAQNLQVFISDKIKPLQAILTYEEDVNFGDLSIRVCRGIAIELYCLSGNQQCLNYVNKQAREIIRTPYEDLEVNTRNEICCAALRNGTVTSFRKMIYEGIFHGDPFVNTDERHFYMRCLSCTESEDVLRDYILATLNPASDFTKDDINLAQRSVYENAGYRSYKAVEMAARKLKSNNFSDDKKTILKGWLKIAGKQMRPIQQTNYTEVLDSLVHSTLISMDERNVLWQLADDAKKSHDIFEQEAGEYLSIFVMNRGRPWEQ